jgi:hypothetical protein
MKKWGSLANSQAFEGACCAGKLFSHKLLEGKQLESAEMLCYPSAHVEKGTVGVLI